MAPLLILLAPACLLLAEIAVFIKAGGAIGALPVLLLTIVTAIVGVALVRAQGIETLQRARRELAAGLPPVRELIEGALLVIAGLCLLVPGFLTDAAGSLLLVPPLRAWIAAEILKRARLHRHDVIVEADYWTEEAPPPPLRRPEDDPWR
ncbi:MAG: FxsA family protein [Rhodothalassiaceae bacterium]